MVDDGFVVFVFVDLEVGCVFGGFDEVVLWIDVEELWVFVFDLVVD